MGERHEGTFTIATDHPSLAGHFPDAPIVPGVVMLDWVMKRFREWQPGGARVTGLKQVKFHAPLLPGELADLLIEEDGASLRFRVTRSGEPIAQGTLTLALRQP